VRLAGTFTSLLPLAVAAPGLLYGSSRPGSTIHSRLDRRLVPAPTNAEAPARAGSRKQAAAAVPAAPVPSQLPAEKKSAKGKGMEPAADVEDNSASPPMKSPARRAAKPDGAVFAPAHSPAFAKGTSKKRAASFGAATAVQPLAAGPVVATQTQVPTPIPFSTSLDSFGMCWTCSSPFIRLRSKLVGSQAAAWKDTVPSSTLESYRSGLFDHVATSMVCRQDLLVYPLASDTAAQFPFISLSTTPGELLVFFFS
jgi:hypothetical protein